MDIQIAPKYQNKLLSQFSDIFLKNIKDNDETLEVLQEDIYKQTLIKIRLELFKELIISTDNANINNSELDAIAIFCGYSDFASYIQSQKDGIKKNYISKKFWTPSIFLLLLFLILFYFIKYFLSRI